jgi:hypothetical protein
MLSLETIKKREQILLEQEKEKLVAYLKSNIEKEKAAQDNQVAQLKDSCKQIILQIRGLREKIQTIPELFVDLNLL